MHSIFHGQPIITSDEETFFNIILKPNRNVPRYHKHVNRKIDIFTYSTQLCVLALIRGFIHLISLNQQHRKKYNERVDETDLT